MSISNCVLNPFFPHLMIMLNIIGQHLTIIYLSIDLMIIFCLLVRCHNSSGADISFNIGAMKKYLVRSILSDYYHILIIPTHPALVRCPAATDVFQKPFPICRVYRASLWCVSHCVGRRTRRGHSSDAQTDVKAKYKWPECIYCDTS